LFLQQLVGALSVFYMHEPTTCSVVVVVVAAAAANDDDDYDKAVINKDDADVDI